MMLRLLTGSHLQSQVKSHCQMMVFMSLVMVKRRKYHHLMMTLHLTLKMTAAQGVETSVTNNSLF